ncbi:MAG: DUF2027 domain-containing protein [Bacteroidota bacterium]|nr:DUF2027 domain-containing protein [Bacteroidota bacterium]MDP4205853.1 DUF2027 domain-containing protein [Bacteroidota bacterium]
MVKIGDKVRYMSTTGGGTVTGLIGKNMANVEDSDGFEVPCLISDLVVIEEAESYEVGKKKQKSKSVAAPEEKAPVAEKPSVKGEIITGRDKPSFLMVFVPDQPSNPVGGEIDAYLINDCNYKVLYRYSHFDGSNYQSVLSGEMAPNTKVKLESFSQTELNTLPVFLFELIYFKDKDDKLNAPVVKEISVNPVKFYKEKTFTKTPYFKKPALLYSLLVNVNESIENITEKDFKEMVRQKQKDVAADKVEKPKRVRTPELIEIDLHIHELIDDTRGLTNTEMLKIQMDRFHEELDSAIQNRVKKVVFIHGIGNGTLKQEVRRELSTRYKKYSFQDASFQEYGYGATMVVLSK